MKYILNRKLFEAKIRDRILPKQAKAVAKNWGEYFLDLEEVEPTDNIQQGKWKLSDEDKYSVFSEFLGINYEYFYEEIGKIKNDEKFISIAKQSLQSHEDIPKSLMDIIEMEFTPYNIKVMTRYNFFNLLNVNETKGDKKMVRDEDGKPILGEDNKPQWVSKEPGEPVFTGNLANITKFIEKYNSSYPENKVSDELFKSSSVQNISSLISEYPEIEDYDIFDPSDIYLVIEHNPEFILNISISKFFDSCQNLYTGSHVNQLLANVFDPNTIPAFLIFDEPYFDANGEKLSSVLPISRLLIRSIEPFGEDEDKDLYFDDAYPYRMDDKMKKIIQEYTDNTHNLWVSNYYYFPDLPQDVDLNDPYMDNLSLSRGMTIGKNIKKLEITRNFNWREVKISKNNNLEEVVISSTKLPKNFTSMGMKFKWLKFKYLTLNSLKIFDNIETKSIAFEKCEVTQDVIKQVNEIWDVEKLSLKSVDIDGDIDLSILKNLEHLELIYTLDDDSDISKQLKGLDLNKIVVSGDMVKNEKNKRYLKLLEDNGVEVILKGLVL